MSFLRDVELAVLDIEIIILETKKIFLSDSPYMY